MADIQQAILAKLTEIAAGMEAQRRFGVNVINTKDFPTAQSVEVTKTPPTSVANFPVNQNVSLTNEYLNTGSTDGGHLTIGATTDSAVSNPASPGTLVALLKGLLSKFASAFAVTVNNFPATQLVSGAVSVSNFPATQPISGSVTVSNFPNPQPVAVSNFPNPQSVTVSNFPNPQPTRELMNTGRQQVCLSWENIAGTASESLATFTNGSRGGVALVAASSYMVSAGKTLRVQSVVFSFGQNGSSACNYRARIRQGTTVSAPVILAAGAGGPSNTCNELSFPVPDGLEIPSGQSVCLSHIDTSTGGLFSCCLVGFEY